MSNLILPEFSFNSMLKIVGRGKTKRVAYKTDCAVDIEYRDYTIAHHGTLIAHVSENVDGSFNKIELSNGGWDSRTTAARLHAIVSAYTDYAVGITGGKTVLRDENRRDIAVFDRLNFWNRNGVVSFEIIMD